MKAGTCQSQQIVLRKAQQVAWIISLTLLPRWVSAVFSLIWGAWLITAQSSEIVINEIHYNPADNTLPLEFIELHNPASNRVDLTGWRLRGGVDYDFPLNSVINANGYLVVAQNPGVLSAAFQVSALGPWQGALNNDGERITLRDSEDRLVDEVEFRSEFPWPIAANGSGSSMELINPALDNNLGSSWKTPRLNADASSNQVLIADSDSAWHYRKGTSEASTPTTAWRKLGFEIDATWQIGHTPIGYGDGDDNTSLDDMRNGYSTVFLRHGFTLANPDIPDSLELRLYVDDGAIVWINGTEVARRHVSEGEKAYNALTGASDHEAAWEMLVITNAASFLVNGPNMLAIQAINQTLGSTDLSVDAELRLSDAAEVKPTPGRRNLSFQINAPPNIRQVHHDPQTPRSTDSILITAKVTDPDGVASVHLECQIVPPGGFIPSRIPWTIAELNANAGKDQRLNPAFETNWTALSMADNGTSGDALAGDSIYSILVPPQPNRTLFRYRIVVADSLQASWRAPFSDDPSLNFACFVYNGVPDYEEISASTLTSLPVYFLITRAQDQQRCTAYSASDQLSQGSAAWFAFNWEGAFVYEGEVYDHVRYRLRGANGRYQAGKRSFRIKFNEGRYLAARDQNGQFYPAKWSSLNTAKGQSNRQTLTYALNEAINYFLWNRVGVPAPMSHFFHFRVVDEAAEAPDRYGGDFWGLSWAQENYDVRFLESHGLAKGNLYKLINSKSTGAEQLRYQAAQAVTDGSDMANIESNLTGYQTTEWLLAHVNYPLWYRYHAVCEAIRNYDFWPSANKNAAYYFEPFYTPQNHYFGRLWILPWDSTDTWGPTWNNGHDVAYNGIFSSSASGGDSGQNLDLQKDYRNTVRELRDLLFQPDQIEPVIDAFSGVIRNFVPADLARWSNAPAATGNYRSLGNPGPALSGGLAGYTQDLKNFLFVGGNHSWWIDRQSVSAGGWVTRLDSVANDASIPQRPIITYEGPEDYPLNALRFRTSDFIDRDGSNTFAALQWRIAEALEPSTIATNPVQLKLEWDAAWDSGELSNWSPVITIPPTVVNPNRYYRARARHKDTTGRWSRWSAPLAFTPSAADLTSVLHDNLVISEIMYHPPALQAIDGDDLEFLELRNIGTTTLDLGGLFFSEGIEFTFPLNTSLDPGKTFLLARNPVAFAQKYPDAIVQGVYSGKLSNEGETLTLSHPHAGVIHSITYDDDDPWPAAADGAGNALVWASPGAQDNITGSQPSHWQSTPPSPGSSLDNALPHMYFSIQLDPADHRPILSLFIEAHQACSIQYSDRLEPPLWLELLDLPAAPTNRIELFRDPTTQATRFYRAAATSSHEFTFE